MRTTLHTYSWSLLKVALVSCVLVAAHGGASPAEADETIFACGSYGNGIFGAVGAFGINPHLNCPDTAFPIDQGFFIQTPGNNVVQGSRGYFYADAPAGLAIDRIQIASIRAPKLNNGNQYGGGFFWGPGNTMGATANPFTMSDDFGVIDGTAGFPTSSFGFQVVCGRASCTASGDDLDVDGLTLTVEETSGPSISAGGLWGASGWVRGTWPVSVTGDSPSGICELSASISGDPVQASGAMAPNQTVWHQCNGSLSSSMNTALAPNGPDTMSVSDSDAAGLSHGATETIHVDNEPPTLSLSGPSTALSTAGTQYVTASVGAGPSGAYGADCSVDGGSQTFYAGASPRIPVSGVGQHTVTCTGLNNAMSSSGQRASSTPASFNLDIQQPTEEAITFSKIADALTCRTIVKRVKVLGKPHHIRLHGHRVVIRRYHEVKRHVRRCHARTMRRKVLVPLTHHGKVVRRHGHIVRVRRTQRVVVLPHRIHRTLRHVRHGRGTTVSGVLLLSDGTPLAGQTVTVLGSPNDADPQFTPISTATTNADGYWTAKLPPGPSRLIEAQYGGSATDAAVSSTLVRTIVPAKLRILSATRRVAWGATATFTGRVYGGYIPRGGINIRLRYGYRAQSITYGVKTHVGPSGRFRTTFTFGPGDPRDHIRFHFQFATLPGGNYPFHTAKSNTVVVRVGGHPAPARPRRRKSRKKKMD